ncbi:MAG: hypothetical protein ACFCD0_23025 [Gemmataceae bacterium]
MVCPNCQAVFSPQRPQEAIRSAPQPPASPIPESPRQNLPEEPRSQVPAGKYAIDDEPPLDEPSFRTGEDHALRRLTAIVTTLMIIHAIVQVFSITANALFTIATLPPAPNEARFLGFIGGFIFALTVRVGLIVLFFLGLKALRDRRPDNGLFRFTKFGFLVTAILSSTCVPFGILGLSDIERSFKGIATALYVFDLVQLAYYWVMVICFWRAASMLEQLVPSDEERRPRRRRYDEDYDDRPRGRRGRRRGEPDEDEDYDDDYDRTPRRRQPEDYDDYDDRRGPSRRRDDYDDDFDDLFRPRRRD